MRFEDKFMDKSRMDQNQEGILEDGRQ